MRSSPIGPDRVHDFLDLAWRLNGEDPRWVPPLRAVQARDLLGQGTLGRYAETLPLLCERGGEVVGRLAAIHNPRLPGVGQLGYFEAVDDPAVLESLLAEAVPWLQARGARSLWGPMDGGAHRAHRFMTRGFQTEPFLFEPRNPPYYPRLWEAQGFRPFHRWYSYELSPAAARDVAGRLERAVERALRTRRRHLFDLADPALWPRLHRILDRVWTGHVGYASIDQEELVECYAGIVAMNPPEYLGVVTEAAGQDVALGLCYPDYAAEVRALDGDAAGWGRWLGAGLPPRLVLHTVAVVPEERGGGAAILIIDHALHQLQRDGFQQVLVALVTEEFELFRRFAAPSREYALYRRDLE